MPSYTCEVCVHPCCCAGVVRWPVRCELSLEWPTLATVPSTVVASLAALLCACCAGLLHPALTAVAVFPHTCLALPCVLNNPNSRQLHFLCGTAPTSSCPSVLLLVVAAAEDCSPLLSHHCTPCISCNILFFGGSDSCTAASHRLRTYYGPCQAPCIRGCC